MRARSKAISALLVLAIATAQLLCSCQSVLASVVAPTKPAAHACCEKKPARQAPTNHDCPHCDGSAAVSAATTVPDGATHISHDFVALPLQQSTLLTLTVVSIDRPARSDSSTPLPASTLLELHCALLC